MSRAAPTFFIFTLALVFCVAPANGVRGDAEQDLGRLLFTDPNLSLNRNQSCSTCHSLGPATNPATQLLFLTPGFVDPLNVETGSAVSKGSVAGDFGLLNAPSVGYTAFAPDFYLDTNAFVYTGGLFWNGRATNLEAQAMAPFTNSIEMAMPSEWSVVTRLKENTNYVALFSQIYGLDLDAIPAGDLAPATNPAPGAVPAVYAALAQAIAEFERSPVFNQFTSKFDFWLAGMTQLSSNELAGYNLFNGKANCANCHVTISTSDRYGNPIPPLFTDFTYANVGLPRNWRIPGAPPPDAGLGGRADIAAAWPDGSQLGLHKVMSLRNVAVTAPYGHNGVLTSLPQVVHFYNTRDNLGVVDSNTNAGFGVTGWPAPEMNTNVNNGEMGKLRLTADEESQLVAFMETLTDNYPATGVDSNVPPGTPSPFASTVLPTIPANLVATGAGRFNLFGRLGKTFNLQSANSLAAPVSWQSFGSIHLGTNGASIIDTNPLPSARFYRAAQTP